jgi:hypothetical protein
MPTDLPRSRIAPEPKSGIGRFLDRWRGHSGTREERRGDLTVAALGITLGLTAAIFPWYVFFNQDQFGVRAMRFDGQGPLDGNGGRMPVDLPFPEELVVRQVERGLIPLLELDRISTGNVPDDEMSTGSVPVDQQPFPGVEKPPVRFSIVHIENGRVMVADDGGVWLARIGSRLPDASKIASIQRKDGKWVVITDRDEILTPDE